MKKSLSLAAIGVCLALAGCSDSKNTEEVEATNIYSVSDFDYTMNSKQAVSMSFGQTKENFCSATIYRSSVTKGYKVQSKQNNNKSISVDCNWDGKYYVQSSKHSTSVDFEITDLDKNAKNAVLNISVKLIEPKSGEYFTLNNVALNLSGSNFDSLVKEI